MTSVFKLPLLGETMETGRVAQWLKQPGQSFRRGETIVEVETDKTTVEVPALSDGTMVEILAEAGKELKVGEPLCVIQSDTPLETCLRERRRAIRGRGAACGRGRRARTRLNRRKASATTVASAPRRARGGWRARRESTSQRSSAPDGADASRFVTSSCTPKRRRIRLRALRRAV